MHEIDLDAVKKEVERSHEIAEQIEGLDSDFAIPIPPLNLGDFQPGGDVVRYTENPELVYDTATMAMNRYLQMECMTYPEQIRIYENLANRFKARTILEVGCGVGTGAALLSFHNRVIATDKYNRNLTFVKRLYPWLNLEIYDVTESPIDNKVDTIVAVEVIEHLKDYETAMRNMIHSATLEVWLSTPNRRHPDLRDNQPLNRHHVREFYPEEILEMASRHGVKDIDILNWQDFAPLKPETKISPLVYRIRV